MRGLRLAFVTVIGAGIVAAGGVAEAGTLSTPGAPFAFGNRAVFGGSFPGSQTLNNAGSSTVVTGFTMGATGCGEFTATATGLPVTLMNGEGMTIDLTYDPMDRTADTCTVTIENDSGGAAETFQITGDGTAAQISVNPTTFNFGDRRVNTSAALPTTNLAITNNGELNASVSTALADGTMGFSAAAGPVTVNAGATVNVVVTFDALVIGAAADTAMFTAPNSVTTAMTVLSGNGIVADLTLPADPFNLGSPAVGASVTTPVTFTNPAPGATADVTVQSLTLNNTEFAFSGTDHGCIAGSQACTPTGGTIAVNGTTAYNIRCTPTAGGLRTAVLTIVSTDFDPGDPTQNPTTQTLNLQCTGAPTIVNTTPTAFAAQRVGTTSAFQTVTISNPTGAADYTFTATVSGNFVLSCASGDSTCFTNRTVPGGGNSQVRVSFAPLANGPLAGTITVTAAAAANSPRTIALSGTGIRPLIDVTSPLAFGPVPVLLAGGSTVPTLQIRNTLGTDALSIPSMAITGTTDISFAFGSCTSGQACNSPLSIPSGGNTTITLRCDPSTTGPITGNLAITSDSNSPTATTVTNVALTCTGTQPNVMVSTATLVFGPQRRTTTSASQPITITNPVGANVGSTSYAITSPSTEFTFTCAGGCSGSLDPGEVVTVNVSFTPSGLGPRSGTITISTPEASPTSRTVDCTGTGVEPAIALRMPTPVTPPVGGGVLSFVNIQPGQTSAAQTIQIENTGTQSLSIMTVTNSNTTDFDLSPGGTGPVAVGGFQMWTVTCSPDTLGTGTKTGMITILNDSANATTVTVQLTCSVVQGRIVIASAAPVGYQAGPNLIDFGPVILTQMNATVVTIRNDGNQVVTLGTIGFAATDQGFTVGTPSSTTVAANGGTVTLPVAFAPTINTQGTTTLSIASNWNTLSLNVVGDGQNVGVDISPDTVQAIGNVPWDGTAQRTFTVRNNGQAPAPITTATLSNNGAGDFTLVGFTSQTLTNNQTMTFRVDATPTDMMLGPHATTLTVNVNLVGQAPLVVDLNYASVGPGIEISQGATVSSAVNFGGVDLQAGPRVITVTVRNTGQSALDIDAVSAITGANAARFALTLPSPPQPQLIGLIPAGESRTFNVTYTPTMEKSMANPDTAELVITTGGYFVGGILQQPALQRITLSGWGIDRHIGLPTEVAFGDVYRNPNADDARATEIVRVCNTGEAALVVSMVTGQDAPFAVVGATGFTVPGMPATGESCTDVTVEFRPTAYGDYTDTLTVVNDDSGNDMAAIPLSGRGIPRPVLVTPGSLVEPARVVVGVPVRLTEIIAGGVQAMNPDADETFRIEPRLTMGADTATLIGTPSATIAPGATETYELEFIAKAAGPIRVVVDVFLDDDDQPHQTVTIDLVGVEIEVGGGVGCDAGGGRTGWLVLALGALGLVLVRRRRAGAARGATLAALLVALAVAGAAGSAQAQVSRDIELGTFHVTPATETAMFAIETPQIAMKGAWAIGLSVNHARSALTAVDGEKTTTLVEGRTQLELGFAYAVLDRLELGARVPVIQQSGQSGTDGAPPLYGLKAPEGTAIGDAAISAKLGLVSTPKLGLALAVEGTIPTGKNDQFAGGRTASGQGRLLLGLSAGKRLNLAFNAGFLGRGKAEFSKLAQGNAVVYGAGVSVRAAEKLWVIGEAFGEIGITKSESMAGVAGSDPASARPLEATLGLRYRLGQATSIALGGGRGLMNGVGAPMVRGFFMLTVSPRAKPDVELHPYIPPPPRDVGDDDGDGVVNADDACKLDAEDKDMHQDGDGCPDPDNDGDGLLDADDKCANEPEDKDGFEDGDGCIDADNDGDGVLDVDDKCPTEAEDKDGFEDGDGCEEPDNDKDGVPDVLDLCATEAETINGNADEDGCPDAGDSVIMVMPDRIEVLEPITFQGVTTKLGKNTSKTLAQIGATMRADRKIKRVRITVHVHPRNGGDQALSDKRAAEVRDWLVNWGVEPERLDAKGIGSKRPLVPKNQKGAEQINDRVELIIFERQ